MIDRPETPAAVVAADWARSGAMALTGRRSGPPLLAPTSAATAAAWAVERLEAATGRVTGVDGAALLGERAALAGYRRRAPWSAGGGCRAVRARDGWVAVSLVRPDDAVAVAAAVERDGVDAHPWRGLDRWALDRAAAEVADRLQLLGVAAGAVTDDPVRRWPPWRASASGRRRDRREVPPPLVVDLSALWAGPLCGHLLGLAGATVVRVESTRRPDGNRAGVPAFDDLLHAGQPSVALDFAAPDGRARLRELVRAADIVVTSARPRALAALGIDPVDTVRAHTDAVFVTITAYPPDDSGAVGVGFGDDVAMAAGAVRRLDGRPVPCGDALADPLTGTHAAAAAAAAHSAGGRHVIALSLWEVVASTLAPLPDLPVERARRGWQVGTDAGAVPVAAPRARAARGTARPLGADNPAVFGGPGIRLPTPAGDSWRPLA